jgi:uncharacterized membrane protein
MINTALLMIGLDYIWIKYFIGDLFIENVELIQKEPFVPRIKYAIPAYLSMLVLYFYFGKNLSVKEMFVFGFCIYAVFDFTNLVIFRRYKWNIAVLDMIWGGLLFSTCKYFNL